VNNNYALIGIGCLVMVFGLVSRDWFLLFTGFSFAFSGWIDRKTEHSPWVKHPSIRDSQSNTDK
jgi:hypothetical protein